VVCAIEDEVGIAGPSSKLKDELENRRAKIKKAVEQERSNELVRITSAWKKCL
jgi:hypothetical protein